MWYYMDEGVQVGPLSESEFQDLVRFGKIGAETMVWQEGMPEWKAYAMLGKAVPVATNWVTCSECHKQFPPDEVIRFDQSWVCSSCKPVFFQRVKEGAALPGAFRYAGFWVRFCAKFIDGVLIWIVEFGLLIAVGGLLGLSLGVDSFQPGGAANIMMLVVYPFLIGISLLYSVWFLGKYGATPGKMALGLRVVTSSGEPITYGKAFARFFAELVSAIVCYIGYIMVAFDEQKKSLHDQICDTRVIRK